MKKIFLLGIIFIGLAIISCDENTFSPKGDYQPRFSVNCIVRADTAVQIATVFKSYDVPGFDPLENHTDPFVKDCFVRIWRQSGAEVHIFKDSSVTRLDSTRYATPINFYYINDFEITENDSLELEVLLPNGNRLRAFTKVPRKVEFDFGNSDRILPPDEKSDINFLWQSQEDDLIYAPELVLVYFKNENGARVKHEIKMPIDYVDYNGTETLVYPRITARKYLNFSVAALDKFMASISEGDPNKSNYTIQAGYLNLFVYDQNLSGYFSSTSKIVDQFSVKIDELDFSNVQGGFGIFGSFIAQKFSFLFDEDYIKSFGYNPGL